MPASRMILPKRSWSSRIMRAEPVGIARRSARARLADALLHVGQLGDLGDFLGKPRDDVRRRLGRRGDAEEDLDRSKPGTPLSAMVGTCGSDGARCGDATPSTLTLPAATCGITAVGAAQIIGIWPASRSLSASAGAAIRHVHDVDLGERVQHQQREMMRRADAGRAGRKLAGLLLGERDQFLDVVRRERRLREQHQRRGRDLARPARSRRSRRTARSCGATCAARPSFPSPAACGRRARALATESVPTMPPPRRAVLDHHRLLEPLLQLLGDQPPGGVDAAARADRHHQRDLALRSELRLRRRGRQAQRGNGQPAYGCA